MEAHYGPSHFKNSDGNRAYLSMTGKHTASTLVHTATVVGLYHIMISSHRIRRRDGDTRTDTMITRMERAERNNEF
jgi:hypothetical protein